MIRSHQFLQQKKGHHTVLHLKMLGELNAEVVPQHLLGTRVNSKSPVAFAGLADEENNLVGDIFCTVEQGLLALVRAVQNGDITTDDAPAVATAIEDSGLIGPYSHFEVSDERDHNNLLTARLISYDNTWSGIHSKNTARYCVGQEIEGGRIHPRFKSHIERQIDASDIPDSLAGFRKMVVDDVEGYVVCDDNGDCIQHLPSREVALCCVRKLSKEGKIIDPAPLIQAIRACTALPEFSIDIIIRQEPEGVVAFLEKDGEVTRLSRSAHAILRLINTSVRDGLIEESRAEILRHKVDDASLPETLAQFVVCASDKNNNHAHFTDTAGRRLLLPICSRRVAYAIADCACAHDSAPPSYRETLYAQIALLAIPETHAIDENCLNIIANSGTALFVSSF